MDEKLGLIRCNLRRHCLLELISLLCWLSFGIEACDLKHIRLVWEDHERSWAILRTAITNLSNAKLLSGSLLCFTSSLRLNCLAFQLLTSINSFNL